MANREGYVQAFNRLPQHQQIAAILIQEDWEDQPDIAKERYLHAPEHRWARALLQPTNNEGVMVTLMRETDLRHIVEFFIGRRRLGGTEHINPKTLDVAIPVGSPYVIEGKMEQQFDLERWKRKVQAKDLRNVKAFLRKGLLSTESIEHFNMWKEDIARAT